MQSLQSIHTSEIVPVDLNSIMYDMETILSRFHGILGNEAQEIYYERQALYRKKAFDLFLWNQTDSIWRDYDSRAGTQLKNFYLSSVFPLWLGPNNRTAEELTQLVSLLSEKVAVPL